MSIGLWYIQSSFESTGRMPGPSNEFGYNVPFFIRIIHFGYKKRRRTQYMVTTACLDCDRGRMSLKLGPIRPIVISIVDVP